jgi:hypothetical protein
MQLSIVEDSAELVELLAKGPRAAGYEADIFSSLNEATTFYSACIPDLGLQDGDAFMIFAGDKAARLSNPGFATHGGGVSTESADDKGSCFTVRLPVSRGEATKLYGTTAAAHQ